MELLNSYVQVELPRVDRWKRLEGQIDSIRNYWAKEESKLHYDSINNRLFIVDSRPLNGADPDADRNGDDPPKGVDYPDTQEIVLFMMRLKTDYSVYLARLREEFPNLCVLIRKSDSTRRGFLSIDPAGLNRLEVKAGHDLGEITMISRGGKIVLPPIAVIGTLTDRSLNETRRIGLKGTRELTINDRMAMHLFRKDMFLKLDNLHRLTIKKDPSDDFNIQHDYDIPVPLDLFHIIGEDRKITIEIPALDTLILGDPNKCYIPEGVDQNYPHELYAIPRRAIAQARNNINNNTAINLDSEIEDAALPNYRVLTLDGRTTDNWFEHNGARHRKVKTFQIYTGMRLSVFEVFATQRILPNGFWERL